MMSGQAFRTGGARALVIALLALACSSTGAQPESAPISPEQVAAGANIYAQNCSVCHGPQMVEQGGGFFDLRTFPPTQRARFFNSVSNGKNSMPPWKSVLTQDEIASLWAYVVAGQKQ